MKILIKIWQVIDFSFFYMKRLIISNLYVAYDILTPTLYTEPAIIAVPIEVKSNHEILMLVNLISMTPGTLSLDVANDKKTIYVHTMYLENDEDFLRKIKTLEQHIHKLFT